MDFFLKKIFFLKRSNKIQIFIFLDAILSSFSLWASFSIRLEKFYNPLSIDIILYIIVFLVFIFIQITTKSYLQFSRNFNISSINYLIRNFLFLLIILLILKYSLLNSFFIPGSILLTYSGVFFLISLFKNSLVYNLYYYLREKLKHSNSKIFLYDFNNLTLKYLENYNKLSISVAGVYENRKKIKNLSISNIQKVQKKDILEFIKKRKITDVVISKNNSYENKIKYYKKFSKLNCRVLFLNEIYNDNNLKTKNELFQPKINDILNFDHSNSISNKKIRNILSNKIIFILGGAGSIGSQLVEGCLKFKPKKIIIIDKDEFEIFNLKKKYKDKKNISIKLIDAKYEYYLENLFNKNIPDVVFNAAAYKHVDIVEENSNFSIYNNIKVALNVCKLCKKYNVKINLLVSTDKAVKPKSLMGISKNICEKIYLTFSYKNNLQKNLIVRFGNVAGSKGSVLPYFQNLINLRQPLTVTNKRATRYLMSIKEAADLIIKVSEIGINSKIYILDMGEPQNINEIAKLMIRMNGLTIKNKSNPSGDIPIKFIGLKKGEKIHEKLSYNKKFLKTIYKKILLCDEVFDDRFIINKINILLNNIHQWSEKKIKFEITKLIKNN